MPSPDHLSSILDTADCLVYFNALYGSAPDTILYQKNRYRALLDQFTGLYPDCTDAEFFSAPGRTEIGGNHTDHNAGRVLAAAVDKDTIAVAAKNESGLIRLHSEGYAPITLHLDNLDRHAAERYTSAALIRGMLSRFKQLGLHIGGIDAAMTSAVPKGSGLSSSAAFEMLVATILNHLYNLAKVNPILLAQIGQYAENEYFGKPSGLMDQATSAIGGFVSLDFKDPARPLVRGVDFDFAASGYTLVIVDTGGDHADLTAEYAAVQREMRLVAHTLGGEVLREFSEHDLFKKISSLREIIPDRAILRALHFFRDDQRVSQQIASLENGNFQQFLRLVSQSGLSSWMLLQNCYPPGAVDKQPIPLALAASQAVLGDRGAWRVHGGGFAGTIQAYVPNELLSAYTEWLEAILGPGSCHPVLVRSRGAVRMP